MGICEITMAKSSCRLYWINSANVYLFILVNSYSKWIEVIPTKTATTAATIRILRNIFAQLGLPHILVRDNGTCFKSNEFESYMIDNGITHEVTVPYHPATNGQVERYIQTTKKTLCTMELESRELHFKLSRSLFRYRKFLNVTTDTSPAELMFGRQIKCRLDLVKRDVSSEIIESYTIWMRKIIEDISMKVMTKCNIEITIINH